uniref:Uncharacterized protein n=1 Tax=viral metagenome TaxID=1070528 RepID=A0A6C0J7M7_9ZZZZ
MLSIERNIGAHVAHKYDRILWMKTNPFIPTEGLILKQIMTYISIVLTGNLTTAIV